MNILLPLLLLNDGYMESGEGPAHLGKSPTTVEMRSEDIRLTIGRDTVRTTCDFVFVNHGPATTVRMGFPNDMDNMEEEDYAQPLKPILFAFRTWVDGREVKAKLVRAAKGDPHWSYFTKEVSFARNGTRKVRVTYSTDIGILAVDGVIAKDRYQRTAGYVVSSGKGWWGKIGRATISTTFLPSSRVKAPVRFYNDVDEPLDKTPERIRISRDPRTVWASGPGKITVHGRTLTFTARNLEPREEDDLFFRWGLVKGPDGG